MAKDKIKVIHVLGKLQMGGAETLVMNIYRNIDRSKIQFDFIVHGDEIGDYEEEILKMGGKIYRVPKYKGYNHFEYKKSWNIFFKEHPEYKIIHCHIRSTASIILKIAKKYGLKTISHSHSTSNGKGVSSLVKYFFQKNIPQYADYLFACSKKSAQWLYGNKLFSSNKCFIINNAIDFNKFAFNDSFRKEIRKKYNISDESFVVGHVGRFDKVKNHHFIIDIISKTKKDKNIVYMLCGDGPLKEEIKSIVESKKMSRNVIFVSSTSEIYKYYSAFDLFILPSLYEGLGMVLIEAQYSGLKCVVSPFIPSESKVSDNYIIKDLSVDLWSEFILTKTISKRKCVSLYAAINDYDINSICKYLENFYLERNNVR